MGRGRLAFVFLLHPGSRRVGETFWWCDGTRLLHSLSGGERERALEGERERDKGEERQNNLRMKNVWKSVYSFGLYAGVIIK